MSETIFLCVGIKFRYREIHIFLEINKDVKVIVEEQIIISLKHREEMNLFKSVKVILFLLLILIS